MFARTVLLLLLLPLRVGIATANDELGTIVSDLRAGRSDVCRDDRWIAWWLEEGSAGVARIRELKLRASDARNALPVEDPAFVVERAQLAAVGHVLDAVSGATSRRQWASALARAETAYLNWRARADVGDGTNLPAMLRRRAMWRLVRTRNVERTIDAPVDGGITECLTIVDRAVTERDVLNHLIAVLDRGRFPADATDGPGASTAALALPGTDRGVLYIRANWLHLARVAPPGVLPLWRTFASHDPAPPPTAQAFQARFIADWKAAEGLFAGLSPPASVGEELFRLTRLDQFGRTSMGTVQERYGTDPARADALAKIWEYVNPADVANTARVRDLLTSRDWFDDDRDGDGAEFNAWLIVQHSDRNPAFQREVLDRLERLLPTGRVSRRHYAYLWDRVAAAEGRLQRYGTQYTCKDRVFVLSPTEDPKGLDARRKLMGLEPAPATLGPCG
jgi:hypothetical protein